MEEKHYKKFYSIADTYVIFVIADPVKLNFPYKMIVPRGGCSVPAIMQPNTPGVSPYDDLTV